MGRFVNPGNEAFRVALNSEIYIDKTGLIEYTNKVMNTTQALAVHVIQKNCSRGWKSAEKAILRNI